MISTKKIPEGQTEASGGGKKTQIIQFAGTGTGYGANANWWRLSRTASNNIYTAGYNQSIILSPDNAFADDVTNPAHEQIMFDGIIKEVFVNGDNNGLVDWNCDLAIRGYEISGAYNTANGFNIINNRIIARQTIVIGKGGSLTMNQFSPSSISTEIQPKGTCLRPYFKSEGVNGSNWQNQLIQILIEEV